MASKMSAVVRIFSRELRKNFSVFKTFDKERRCLSTLPTRKSQIELDNSTSQEIVENIKNRDRGPVVPDKYRFIYPEFLPDPDPSKRNSFREKLERMDMIARRTVIDIPEFYVGSILAVTHAEPHAPGKLNRFVGICIERSGCGLRANCVLRNVVDHQGVEMLYDLYDPTIHQIDCLRLEKRLDPHLRYLRDCPPEYSTFSFDMEPEILAEGSAVPLNDIIIPLNPTPWREKWEAADLKGASNIIVTEKRSKKAAVRVKPWEKYDLMKIYRETIPEEEQQQIYSEIYTKLHTLDISRRKLKRKRGFSRPTKTA